MQKLKNNEARLKFIGSYKKRCVLWSKALVSAGPSELELPGSILGDSNIYFNFFLICVALALNTCKTEQWQRKGGKVPTKGHKFISYLITVMCYPH